MSLGQWLRTCMIEKGRAQAGKKVPAINRQAFAAFARTAANLNQLARHLNTEKVIAENQGRGHRVVVESTINGAVLRELLQQCLTEMKALRHDLIGYSQETEERKPRSRN